MTGRPATLLLEKVCARCSEAAHQAFRGHIKRINRVSNAYHRVLSFDTAGVGQSHWPTLLPRLSAKEETCEVMAAHPIRCAL